MSVKKQYRLLKTYEHPCGKTNAGVIETEEEWMRKFNGLQKGDCDIKDDWFQPITPQQETQDGFVWDEQLAKEFAAFVILGRDLKDTNDAMEKFKASKQKPKPERVLYISYLQEDNNAIHHYSFTTTKWLPKEAIKSAIHNLLNGTSTLMDCHQEALEKISTMFSQEQLEEAERKAFEASRKLDNGVMTGFLGKGLNYDTFQDYLNSKQQTK